MTDERGRIDGLASVLVWTEAARFPAMLAFYRDTLGLKYLNEQPVGPGGVMHRLACGSSVIKLVVPDEPAPPTNPRGTRAQTGIRYITILVSNLEELVQRCEDAGAEFHVPYKEFRPGSWYAQVYDPEGNVIALVQESAEDEG